MATATTAVFTTTVFVTLPSDPSVRWLALMALKAFLIRQRELDRVLDHHRLARKLLDNVCQCGCWSGPYLPHKTSLCRL